MEKTRNKDFLEWNMDILISSVKKINLNLIQIIILDILFYFLSGILLYFWLQRTYAKISSFYLPADAMSLGYAKAQELAAQMRELYYLIFFSFILLLVAIIFLASISKGIIWAKTTGTKITFRLISGFFWLNLAWMGFWFLLVIMISLFVEPASVKKFTIAAITLGLYFTNTLYTMFMKKPAFKSLVHAIKLNIAKAHMFLLPYAAVFLLFFAVIKLGALLKFAYSAILIGVAIIICIAIARYYVYELVLEVGKLDKG